MAIQEPLLGNFPALLAAPSNG